jgi:hypothetical protein
VGEVERKVSSFDDKHVAVTKARRRQLLIVFADRENHKEDSRVD